MNDTTVLKSGGEQAQGSDAQRVMEWARELYEQNPNWVQFHLAIWGPGGALEVVFPDRRDRQAFQGSKDGRELQRFLVALRRRDRPSTPRPTVTVTVRLPKTIHEFLTREAAEQGTNLHRLCLAKLTQPLVEDLAEDE